MKLRTDQWEVPESSDCHVPASLLKQWYRELWEPLIPDRLYASCIDSCAEPRQLLELIQQLPDINRLVLTYLVRFLQVREGFHSVCPVLSCPVLFRPVMHCPVPSCYVRSPILLRPVLSCWVMSCPVPSCPVLSCPVSSTVLSCPVPSCSVPSRPVRLCLFSWSFDVIDEIRLFWFECSNNFASNNPGEETSKWRAGTGGAGSGSGFNGFSSSLLLYLQLMNFGW